MDTPRSVGLLWTSDRPDAETSTWQHTALTRDRHPCRRAGFEPTIPTNERMQTDALGSPVGDILWYIILIRRTFSLKVIILVNFYHNLYVINLDAVRAAGIQFGSKVLWYTVHWFHDVPPSVSFCASSPHMYTIRISLLNVAIERVASCYRQLVTISENQEWDKVCWTPFLERYQ